MPRVERERKVGNKSVNCPIFVTQMKSTVVKNESCVVAVRPRGRTPIPDFPGPRCNTKLEEAVAVGMAAVVFGEGKKKKNNNNDAAFQPAAPRRGGATTAALGLIVGTWPSGPRPPAGQPVTAHPSLTRHTALFTRPPTHIHAHTEPTFGCPPSSPPSATPRSARARPVRPPPCPSSPSPRSSPHPLAGAPSSSRPSLTAGGGGTPCASSCPPPPPSRTRAPCSPTSRTASSPWAACSRWRCRRRRR